MGDELGALLIDRVGTRVMHDDAQPPVDDTVLAELLVRAAETAGRVTDALRRGGMQGSLLAEGGADPERSSRKTRALTAAVALTDDLHRLIGRGSGDVAWVDGTRRNIRLRLSPIDVGPVLSSALWGEVTAVLTSATVPPRLVERVGLAGFETNQLNVGSPFDYRAHALLYVARHLPDRRAPEAEAALHQELALLMAAAGGRTLALFTSRRATDAAAEALADLPYALLQQGDLPKGRLLETFAADETSCLFATMGFWQGVDIPGPALSLVTLDRLPFPRPDDPVLQARRARAGGRAFSVVDLPRAATLLAQGSGRLIRTAEDRGVVAVLDPRLATSSYRGVLLATLPPMRRTVDRSEVEVVQPFLRAKREGPRLAAWIATSVTGLGQDLQGAGRLPRQVVVAAIVRPLHVAAEVVEDGQDASPSRWRRLEDDQRPLVGDALEVDGCFLPPRRCDVSRWSYFDRRQDR